LLVTWKTGLIYEQILKNGDFDQRPRTALQLWLVCKIPWSTYCAYLFFSFINILGLFVFLCLCFHSTGSFCVLHEKFLSRPFVLYIIQSKERKLLPCDFWLLINFTVYFEHISCLFVGWSYLRSSWMVVFKDVQMLRVEYLYL